VRSQSSGLKPLLRHVQEKSAPKALRVVAGLGRRDQGRVVVLMSHARRRFPGATLFNR